MRDMNAFYEATLGANFKDASDICLREDNALLWPDIILDCINRFEQEWRLDQVSLLDVSGAFWTTRRVLDHMLARGVPVTPAMRESGRILMCVPRSEGHSFGAQLLSDQLRRVGYHVTLMIDRPNADVFEQLETSHFDVFGLSIGCDQSFLGLADIVAEARIVSENPAMRVALGGSCFETDVSAYDFLNADIVLGQAQDPLACFRNLIAQHQLSEENRHA